MDVDTQHFEDELAALAHALDAALERLRRLTEENASLRRALARNEQARTRVEAMIERLKSLEAAT